MQDLKDLRAIRPFNYNGKHYSTNQLFQADSVTAAMLVARKLAEYVSIAPGTPITTPIEGENKMLKIETVAKPIQVSTATPMTAKRKPTKRK
jgi:hypothetical protein